MRLFCLLTAALVLDLGQKPPVTATHSGSCGSSVRLLGSSRTRACWTCSVLRVPAVEPGVVCLLTRPASPYEVLTAGADRASLVPAESPDPSASHSGSRAPGQPWRGCL